MIFESVLSFSLQAENLLWHTDGTYHRGDNICPLVWSESSGWEKNSESSLNLLSATSNGPVQGHILVLSLPPCVSAQCVQTNSCSSWITADPEASEETCHSSFPRISSQWDGFTVRLYSREFCWLSINSVRVCVCACVCVCVRLKQTEFSSWLETTGVISQSGTQSLCVEELGGRWGPGEGFQRFLKRLEISEVLDVPLNDLWEDILGCLRQTYRAFLSFFPVPSTCFICSAACRRSSTSKELKFTQAEAPLSNRKPAPETPHQ